MKNKTVRIIAIGFILFYYQFAVGQNVGVGMSAPIGKLHIKGSADVSQLIVEANAPQTNINPLLRFRKSTGTDLLWLHSDDSTNVFLGFKAGKVNVVVPQGINNSFIGSRAGYSNTNGKDNTVVGANALFNNTKASLNTAIGSSALYSQSYSPPAGAWWQSNNVAVGFEALYSNQPTAASNGVNNTAVGTFALRLNTTGAQNSAVGTFALYLNTLGTNNTANGYFALYSNTIGNDNIAIGKNALASNTGLSENIAIGNGALYSQSNIPEGWLGGNLAIGHGALYANQPTYSVDGLNNTAIGNYALTSNISGSQNTACGYHALHNDVIGSYNTAVGYKALYANTGKWNTAMGWEALFANTSGEDNTAHGYEALSSNTIGNYNSALGHSSLYLNTTGSDNTAVGYGALYFNTTGSHNISIGSDSGTGAGAPNISNTISIGNNGYLNLASNQSFMGNLSTAWTGGNTTWFTYASDARVKKNVAEDVKGLDFISRLRPVTYNLDINAMREITGNEKTTDYPEKYDVEKIKQSGFLAQEVEQAAKDSEYNFSGITIPKWQNELYTMSYSQFVVPLVKAVQELSQKNQSLVEKNNEQDLLIDNLLQRIEKLETSKAPNNQ
jgi:hypothetical protein